MQNFFESFLSLVRDPNDLAKIESLLHRSAKGYKESAVNYLHKKKTGTKMHMNIQIGDYEVDSIILDLGSDVNILMRQTWNNMRSPQLAWSPIQLQLANQARVTPIG